MENLFTVVIFIIFVLATIIRKTGKHDDTPAPHPEPKNAPDFDDIRDIFTQFFGSDSKKLPIPNKNEQEPIPQPSQVLLEVRSQEESGSKERPEDVIQNAEEYISRTRKIASKANAAKALPYKPPLPVFQSRKGSLSKTAKEKTDKRFHDKAYLIPRTVQDAQKGIVLAEIFGPPLSLR